MIRALLCTLAAALCLSLWTGCNRDFRQGEINIYKQVDRDGSPSLEFRVHRTMEMRGGRKAMSIDLDVKNISQADLDSLFFLVLIYEGLHRTNEQVRVRHYGRIDGLDRNSQRTGIPLSRTYHKDFNESQVEIILIDRDAFSEVLTGHYVAWMLQDSSMQIDSAQSVEYYYQIDTQYVDTVYAAMIPDTVDSNGNPIWELVYDTLAVPDTVMVDSAVVITYDTSWTPEASRQRLIGTTSGYVDREGNTFFSLSGAQEMKLIRGVADRNLVFLGQALKADGSPLMQVDNIDRGSWNFTAQDRSLDIELYFNSQIPEDSVSRISLQLKAEEPLQD